MSKPYGQRPTHCLSAVTNSRLAFIDCQPPSNKGSHAVRIKIHYHIFATLLLFGPMLLIQSATAQSISTQETESGSTNNDQIDMFQKAIVTVRPGFDDFGDVPVSQLITAMKNNKIPMKQGPNKVTIHNLGNGKFKMDAETRFPIQWLWEMQNNNVAMLTAMCRGSQCSDDYMMKIAVVRSLLGSEKDGLNQ